ncbi:MAG TPA: sugar nucleotide-binding protein, partial [Solirubrobacteraceae bacterium]|nr:sugar nucleotide-binding protein [Solirubrobacteraceae bacterium]
LIGSNLAAAAAHQSWSVLGTWRHTPVSVLGARTAALDLADRRACTALAEELEPAIVIHAAAESSPARLERDPRLAELNLLATQHTLAAAHAVRARYVLVSCDQVFSGLRPSGECWEEHDPTEPVNALGRSLLACEHLTQDFRGEWLITRPADVYGVNLSIPAPPQRSGGATGAETPEGRGGIGPAIPEGRRGVNPGMLRNRGDPHHAPPAREGGVDPAIPARRGWEWVGPRLGSNRTTSGNGAASVSGATPGSRADSVSGAATAAGETAAARARHIWGHSGPPLRWVARLRAGQSIAAPPGIRRSPTYAWDYAQLVCELIAQECEGIYNTAGPTTLGRLSHLRLLARAFGCDLELVREGTPADFQRTCGEELGQRARGEELGSAGEREPPESEPPFPLPANTALCDRKAIFMLGRAAVDPFTGHRLMRWQLERLLASAHPPTPSAAPAGAAIEPPKPSYSAQGLA